MTSPAEPMPPLTAGPAATASIGAWLWRRRWLVLGLAVLFTAPRIWYLYTFEPADYDLGIYHGLAAGIADGRGFYSDVLNRDHLAEHWNPVMFGFALLYTLWASAYWLMLGQAAAATATVLGLVWLAERAIEPLSPGRRRLAWWGLLLLFVIYRPFCAAWWFSFQPMIIGAPFVAWAMVFLHLGRMRSLAVAVAILLTTREAAVLTAFGLAWYAWQVAGRPRAAIAIAVGAAGMAALIFGVVMPWARQGATWGHTKRVGIAELPLVKLQYLGGLLWKAGLLPLLAPRIAIAAVPAIALQLVVNNPNQLSGGFHYNAQLSVFLLAASSVGLVRVLQWQPAERWRWLPAGATGGMLLLAAATSDILPLRKFLKTLSPNDWVESHAMHQDLDRALTAEGIGPGTTLAADIFLGPHLCARPKYYSLHGTGTDRMLARVPAGVPVVVRAGWWAGQVAKLPHLAQMVSQRSATGSILVLERTGAMPPLSPLAPVESH